jgi:cell division protein FtsW
MTAFGRADTSVLGRWWWTIDRWTLAAVAMLVGFGILLTLAASPAVAIRLDLDAFHFARRQFVFLPLALAVMFAVSLLSPRGVFRVTLVVLVVALICVAATFWIGVEIKGARRWISLGVVSLQPSEFLKPTMAVVAAWLFAAARTELWSYGNAAAMALFAVVAALLILQPDVGMAFIISAAWFCQFLLAGLGLQWAVLFAGLGLAAMAGAYLLLPHVASRVDRFLDPSAGDNYQIDRSLEAFMSGGLFGRGPGEGIVKRVLPDAHSDFVFAVAGEELGLLACLMIVALFAFVVLRGFTRALQENNLFVMLAASGLLVQFGLQAAVNMASALRLMPAKGMTLPFISYGGSSLLSTGLTVGLLLALTRRRFGEGVGP